MTDLSIDAARVFLFIVRATLGIPAQASPYFVVSPMDTPLSMDQAAVTLSAIEAPMHCVARFSGVAVILDCSPVTEGDAHTMMRLADNTRVGYRKTLAKNGLDAGDESQILIRSAGHELVTTLGILKEVFTNYRFQHSLTFEAADTVAQGRGIAGIVSLTDLGSIQLIDK